MYRNRAMLILMVLVFLAVPITASWAQDAPSAVVPEPRFQFAPVLEGVEVTHDYIIRNTGTAPLLITRIKAG